MGIEEVERRAFRVVGKVQGVGFRWWTRGTAQGLGLGGWVRNESDGSVLVHAMGSPSALRRLQEALAVGPAGGRVDEIVPVNPDATMQGGRFVIEH
jgi:acylphosphatase